MKEKSQSRVKPAPLGEKIVHVGNKNLQLVEDHFGIYIDELNNRHPIKRFTWRNCNRVEAQIINFGARATSLKLPNRKGLVEDVVLGFDDIYGYLHYDNLYMGATIGRVANRIQNGTFAINKKQHWLSVNDGSHHLNGGFVGFDNVIWTPSVEGRKVLLSYISHDKEEGYPGDMFVCISFELTNKNEFIIDMEARTTKPTIINLAHLLYFNLGGHGSGSPDLYRHIVSINANCFLLTEENGLPNGEIVNVTYSKNDFQVPKLLKVVVENNPEAKEGFDSFLCVNRGIKQDLCFVASSIHPPSGRVLEIYSNQYGVYFGTANHFGHGQIDLPVDSKPTADVDEPNDDLTILITTLQNAVAETFSMDSNTDYAELNVLIRKLLKEENVSEMSLNQNGISGDCKASTFSLNSMQIKYLENIAKVASEWQNNEQCQKVKDIVLKLIERGTTGSTLICPQPEDEAHNTKSKQSEAKAKPSIYYKKKELLRTYNTIPSVYKRDSRVHGKNDAIYKSHGAMCFQTQNYPNAVYHRNFPSCNLRPGETYRHTIVYRFFLQSGDPNLWMKRSCPEARMNKNKPHA